MLGDHLGGHWAALRVWEVTRWWAPVGGVLPLWGGRVGWLVGGALGWGVGNRGREGGSCSSIDWCDGSVLSSSTRLLLLLQSPPPSVLLLGLSRHWLQPPAPNMLPGSHCCGANHVVLRQLKRTSPLAAASMSGGTILGMASINMRFLSKKTLILNSSSVNWILCSSARSGFQSVAALLSQSLPLRTATS